MNFILLHRYRNKFLKDCDSKKAFCAISIKRKDIVNFDKVNTSPAKLWRNICKFAMQSSRTMTNYFKYILVLILPILLISCQDDQEQRVVQAKRIQVQNDSIVKELGRKWNFSMPALSIRVQQEMGDWNEWNQFRSELTQKPAGDLSSYRQKTRNLITKGQQLRNIIPGYFAKPAVRSRFDVLVTKVKSLDTFVSVDPVNVKKVTEIIASINYELNSINRQFDEIVRKSEIPKEIGEEEMLRALDTVRHANPESQPQPPTGIQPRPQPQRSLSPGHGAGALKQNN